MSQMYNKTPAELLSIEDEYTAFCFNEALAFIRGMMDRKINPVFGVKKSYSRFSDLYEKYQ